MLGIIERCKTHTKPIRVSKKPIRKRKIGETRTQKRKDWNPCGARVSVFKTKQERIRKNNWGRIGKDEVGGSNPPSSSIETLESQRIQGFSIFWKFVGKPTEWIITIRSVVFFCYTGEGFGLFLAKIKCPLDSDIMSAYALPWRLLRFRRTSISLALPQLIGLTIILSYDRINKKTDRGRHRDAASETFFVYLHVSVTYSHILSSDRYFPCHCKRGSSSKYFCHHQCVLRAGFCPFDWK